MNTLTILLSFWGAIVSTILVAIRVLEWKNDRACIELEAKLCYVYDHKTGDQPQFTLIMVNSGRRKAYLVDAGVMLQTFQSRELTMDDSRMLIPEANSLVLEGGERRVFEVPFPPEKLKELRQPGTAFARLSTGKQITVAFHAYSEADWDEFFKRGAELRQESSTKQWDGITKATRTTGINSH